MKRLESVLRDFAAAGFQVNKDAFEFLQRASENYDLKLLTQEVLGHLARVTPAKPIIDRELIRSIAERIGSSRLVTPLPIPPNAMATTIPLAKDISARLEIINDPSHRIGTKGSVDNFGTYFRDRFNRMSRILNERMEVRGASDISSALNSGQASVRFICMVKEKRDRKTHVLLDVEDEENQAMILVQREDRMTYEVARSVPLDQVVYIEAKRAKGEMFICTKIVLPDIPERKPNKSSDPICAALLSDMHVGSKIFMKDAFDRLMIWLNCRGDDKMHRELASRVKYVIIAGDIVDGVGIYPNQEEELSVADVYQQYKLAAEYIAQIPDYVEVILIPGNHDPTRQSLPQPQVASEFAEPVYRARRVCSLGNPAEIRLHDVRFLLYHGRSLDDVIATVPGMTFQSPHLAMEFLLRCRHVAPEYGKRTPIAPETVDQLVIENVPDVFHAGHIHINGLKKYRGTTIVNSGTWQNQTDYQKRMGLEPTPGWLPIIDLQTLEVTQVSFI